MSTSSSSPTYPTTQREHSVHPVHLQVPSVDKLRHQESLWREDLQSGGNPRTTTPTSCGRVQGSTTVYTSYDSTIGLGLDVLASSIGEYRLKNCVSHETRFIFGALC